MRTLKESLHSTYCQHVLTHPRNKNPEEAISVRNYLLFKITLENANRSGVMCEMTIQDVKESEKYEDKRVVHIAEHKTSTSYGGMSIAFISFSHNHRLLEWILADSVVVKQNTCSLDYTDYNSRLHCLSMFDSLIDT